MTKTTDEALKKSFELRKDLIKTAHWMSQGTYFIGFNMLPVSKEAFHVR